ncbi:hypothetical protein VNPA152081_12180 [Pseudomonas aeruginosa]|nr:hypothetical protein VNPA141826_12080 [Pseudomonas aeruginosa]GLF76147.1 hypothetical protein VNPA152081_12180 [Pseudomonas aeruginosa]
MGVDRPGPARPQGQGGLARCVVARARAAGDRDAPPALAVVRERPWLKSDSRAALAEHSRAPCVLGAEDLGHAGAIRQGAAIGTIEIIPFGPMAYMRLSGFCKLYVK